MLEALNPNLQDVNELDPRPERVRAVLFDPTEERVLLIERSHPEKGEYSVFPGGGLETSDKTPKDGIERELEEELQLSPDDVELSEKVIVEGEEAFFVGTVVNPEADYTIGGPEADRDSASGTYNPEWASLDTIDQHTFPVRPKTIAAIVHEARERVLKSRQ